ncbi:MAG: hypothetical protein EOM83_04505 [Clostridia bacterium]|nr:hypothetical protein [Clostridia bacterium]
MKTLGIVVVILGIIGTLVFGIQAMNKSQSLNIFGNEIVISTISWLPITVSIVLLIGGILLLAFTQKR